MRARERLITWLMDDMNSFKRRYIGGYGRIIGIITYRVCRQGDIHFSNVY